ncbi:MAG: NAD-dependent epimerase/dehydratase family protein, partial [Candidatus Eremiobacteraeota bacterium]|nr:NAD-dependent epimerase/dehydratase family protein [Candidatus Eremiobacteraeota bacterium]
MRVMIFGASGFVGKHLVPSLRSLGHETRTASLRDPQAAADAASGCDAIINLAGEPVAQRWTDETKRKILESRTVAPSALLERLKVANERPRAYISASAVGYYGASLTETFTEESAPGLDFLADVCVQWESVARSAREIGMRVVCVRTG